MKRIALIALVAALAACVLAADALSVRGLAEGRWTHPPQAAQTSTSPARSAGERLPADTVRHEVAVGETFITALPDTLEGRPVTTYTIERAPTFSWMSGFSFFWRPRPEDAGRHVLRFRTAREGAPPDTLVMLVTVEGR